MPIDSMEQVGAGPQRLYFGLFLPSEANDAIDRRIAQLRESRSWAQDARWATRGRRHLTLAFLGDGQEAHIWTARAVPALENVAPFTVDIQDGPALLAGGSVVLPATGADLAAQVLRGLRTPTGSERPFFGHVTIAWPARSDLQFPEALSSLRLHSFTADGVDLIRSDPADEVNPYRSVRRFPLSG